jgi:hypothetical protein
MGLPSDSVNLTPEQIKELHAELRTARHDINNKLACIQACAQLVVYKPDEIQRLSRIVEEQSAATQAALGKFSAAFEKALGITLPIEPSEP